MPRSGWRNSSWRMRCSVPAAMSPSGSIISRGPAIRWRLRAQSGKLARNFQGYTTDDAPALIGLGASSISALPQGYAQNKTEVPDYRKAILAGELAVARGIALDRRRPAAPGDHRAADVRSRRRPRQGELRRSANRAPISRPSLPRSLRTRSKASSRSPAAAFRCRPPRAPPSASSPPPSTPIWARARRSTR